MQRVQARYDAELPPFISIVRHPGRPVILGMDFWKCSIGGQKSKSSRGNFRGEFPPLSSVQYAEEWNHSCEAQGHKG